MIISYSFTVYLTAKESCEIVDQYISTAISIADIQNIPAILVAVI